MYKVALTILIMLIIFTPLVANALPQEGKGLVNCNPKVVNGRIVEECTLQHLLRIAIGLINAAIELAGMVTTFMVLKGGAIILDAGLYGKTEEYENGKQTVFNALIGLGLIIISFLIANALMNILFPEIFGAGTGQIKSWTLPWQ